MAQAAGTQCSGQCKRSCSSQNPAWQRDTAAVQVQGASGSSKQGRQMCVPQHIASKHGELVHPPCQVFSKHSIDVGVCPAHKRHVCSEFGVAQGGEQGGHTDTGRIERRPVEKQGQAAAAAAADGSSRRQQHEEQVRDLVVRGW